MFGKKKKSTPKKPKPAAPQAAPVGGGMPDADTLADLSAELLRLYGERSFDLDDIDEEETATQFAQWARHLLIGAAPPGREDDEAGRAPGPRDLTSLRRAFADHRKHERKYVRDTIGHFREATWAFVHNLRRSLSFEQVTDRQLGHQIHRLETAARGGDAALIRNEAMETVSMMQGFLEQRAARSTEQVQAMAANLDQLREELDTARAEAATDALTGFFNRGTFDDQIEREADLSMVFDKPVSLLILDIDHFKHINDTHGHRCGDEVLRRIAQAISRSFLRKEDFIARYGGEEFAIVLRDTPGDTSEMLAERALHTIRHLEIEFEASGPIEVTASIGIAELAPGEATPEWIERADRALYTAKDAGRDRVIRITPDED